MTRPYEGFTKVHKQLAQTVLHFAIIAKKVSNIEQPVPSGKAIVAKSFSCVQYFWGRRDFLRLSNERSDPPTD